MSNNPNKASRRYTCKECFEYYNSLDLSPRSKQNRIDMVSRHKDKPNDPLFMDSGPIELSPVKILRGITDDRGKVLEGHEEEYQEKTGLSPNYFSDKVKSYQEMFNCKRRILSLDDQSTNVFDSEEDGLRKEDLEWFD